MQKTVDNLRVARRDLGQHIRRVLDSQLFHSVICAFSL